MTEIKEGIISNIEEQKRNIDDEILVNLIKKYYGEDCFIIRDDPFLGSDIIRDYKLLILDKNKKVLDTYYGYYYSDFYKSIESNFEVKK